MHVKDSIFVFALFKEVEVFRWVDIFLDEFRYDSLNSGVQPGLLAKRSKQLGDGSMCAVDGAPLLAK